MLFSDFTAATFPVGSLPCVTQRPEIAMAFHTGPQAVRFGLTPDPAPPCHGLQVWQLGHMAGSAVRGLGR